MNYRFVGGIADGLECTFPTWKDLPVATKLWCFLEDKQIMVSRVPLRTGNPYWLSGTDASGFSHFIADELDYEQFSMTGQDHFDAA